MTLMQQGAYVPDEIDEIVKWNQTKTYRGTETAGTADCMMTVIERGGTFDLDAAADLPIGAQVVINTTSSLVVTAVGNNGEFDDSTTVGDNEYGNTLTLTVGTGYMATAILTWFNGWFLVTSKNIAGTGTIIVTTV